MKKSLSRILSLALVLAMVLSAVPFALAAVVEEDVCSVTVNPPSETLTLEGGTASTTISATATAAAGYTQQGEITWSGDTETVSGSSAVFTATVAGNYSVTATATFTRAILDESGEPVLDDNDNPTYETVTPSATCTIKVVDPNAYEVTLAPTSLELTVGQSKPLTVSVVNGLGESVTPYSVTWSEGDSPCAEVSDGTVTGLKAGSATISASVVPVEGAAAIVKTCAVTVTDGGYIECANGGTNAGGTVTLIPSLKVNGVSVSNVVFSFSGTGVVPNASGKTATVTSKTAGLVEVNISVLSYKNADGSDGTAEIAPITATVRFYGSADIDVTATASTFSFESTSVLSKAYYDNVELKNPSLISVAQLLQDACRYNGGDVEDCTYKIVTSDSRLSAAWSTSLSSLGPTAMTKVQFTQSASSTGNCEATFYIYDSEGRTIAIGDLTIRSGNVYGITYETDYKTSVTFDEDDFKDFWNGVYTSSTNTLKYVVFGVSSTVPVYGDLYTTASSSTRKTVTSTMKFQPDYANSSSYYDLDTVTYVPSTKYTTAYTVEIPFTAYGGAGNSSATALSGVVILELNSTTNSITSRGVVFGTGTYSIADQMVADYKAAKNTDLAYVIFDLPDVEDGRLYYDYEGILESARVSSKDLYYVDPTSKQLDLEKVAFIPAAGTTGQVTVQYVGYDEDGKNPYQGKIVFNVTAKTQSAIFTDVTTTYSWAADSIDFLYYEEVVNGTSSTKFGPSASITRGDFMIMLYRAFLEEDYGDFPVTSNFADVVKGTDSYSKETYQAVGVAKYLGIALGDGTNFNPKASITREEAMTLIYRTLDEVELDLEYTSSKTTSSFSDYSKVSSYAQTSISYLIKHGIVIGSNGLINPKSNITRAEMAVILHRVLTY